MCLYVHRQIQGQRTGAACTTERLVKDRVCVASVRKLHTFYSESVCAVSAFQPVQEVICSRCFGNTVSCVIIGDDFLLHSEEVKTKRSQVSDLLCLVALVKKIFFLKFVALKLNH